jgi:phosphopantetheinyl transferase
LDKIFTQNEQLLIATADPDIMVWNLWSRKEAYKIYNRATGVRGYFPLNLVCVYENTNSGPCYVMAIPIYQTEIVRIKFILLQ